MYTHACIQIPVHAELVDGGAPARLARICQPRELRGMCLRGGAKGFDNKMLKADHPKDCIAHTDHPCDLDVFFFISFSMSALSIIQSDYVISRSTCSI
jgi:hypothetical protein